MAEEKPLSRHDLLRQIQTLQTELVRMSKQIEAFTSEPGIKRPLRDIDPDWRLLSQRPRPPHLRLCHQTDAKWLNHQTQI